MATVQLNNDEREQVFELAENVTGNCQRGPFRREIIITNVQRRMQATQHTALGAYLEFAVGNDREFAQLLSALTIHTTEFFREIHHFEKIEALLRERADKWKRVRILSAACSTGEEAYSAGMVCELRRGMTPGFEWNIDAFDIDPISVEVARKGVFPESAQTKIPKKYQAWIRFEEKGFSVLPAIQTRIHFSTANLIQLPPPTQKYDIIICRNVLIYFAPDRVEFIIQSLLQRLSDKGILILGHAESVDPRKYALISLGNAVFEKPAPSSSSGQSADTQRTSLPSSLPSGRR